MLIPICIAAFFGYVFGGVGKGQEVGKLPIAVVDEDQSNVTRAIAADLAADKFLQVTTLTRDVARAQVQKGTQNAAAVFPRGFGQQSVDALFSGRDKPHIELLVDPSQATSAQLIQGLLAQYSMKDISKEAFNGVTGQKSIDDQLTRLDGLEATPERAEFRSLLQAAQRLNRIRDEARPPMVQPLRRTHLSSWAFLMR